MDKRRSLIAFLKQGDFWFYLALLVGVTILDRATRTKPGFDLGSYLVVLLRSRSVQALAVLAAAVGAIFLFWVRQRHRKVYAAVEFFVAVWVVCVAFRNGTQPQMLTFVTGGVYVMVRSFDNWSSATPINR
jgi:hypothetical protein